MEEKEQSKRVTPTPTLRMAPMSNSNDRPIIAGPPSNRSSSNNNANNNNNSNNSNNNNNRIGVSSPVGNNDRNNYSPDRAFTNSPNNGNSSTNVYGSMSMSNGDVSVNPLSQSRANARKYSPTVTKDPFYHIPIKRYDEDGEEIIATTTSTVHAPSVQASSTSTQLNVRSNNFHPNQPIGGIGGIGGGHGQDFRGSISSVMSGQEEVLLQGTDYWGLDTSIGPTEVHTAMNMPMNIQVDNPMYTPHYPARLHQLSTMQMEGRNDLTVTSSLTLPVYAGDDGVVNGVIPSGTYSSGESMSPNLSSPEVVHL